ncbi:MAG: alpha/beta hydrolase fold domain-containing protein, partial [Saprospiraceae bacterium]
VVMPAYRLVPWAWHEQMREDVGLALQTTLELLRKKDLGQKKILIGGMSAGATLAAHLAFDRPALEQLGLTQALFSGFMSFAGPLDLAQMPPFGAVRRYAGGRPGSAEFEAANPVTYLQGDERIPALLTHGTVDAIVPFACSESFFRQYSGPKTLRPLPGRTHLDALRFATDDTETARWLQEWLADK